MAQETEGWWETSITWLTNAWNSAVHYAEEGAAKLADGVSWGIQLIKGAFGLESGKVVPPEEILGGLLTQTVAHIDRLLGEFLFAAWEELAKSGLTRLATTAAVLSVATLGYLALMGKIRATVQEMALQMVRIVAVVYVLAHGGPLVQKAYRAMTETPMAIGEVLVDAGRGLDVNAAANDEEVYPNLLAGLDRLNVLAWAWYSKASFTTVKMKSDTHGTLVNLVLGVTVFAICYSGFLFLLSRIAVGLLLSLAPVFVIFLLFQPTRHLVQNWGKTLLGFCLIPILLSAVWGLLFGLVYGHLSLASTWIGAINVEALGSDVLEADVIIENLDRNDVIKLAPHAVTMLMIVLLIAQIPGWASAIAGGATLQNGLGLLYAKGRLADEYRSARGEDGGSRSSRPPPGMRGG